MEFFFRGIMAVFDTWPCTKCTLNLRARRRLFGIQGVFWGEAYGQAFWAVMQPLIFGLI